MRGRRHAGDWIERVERVELTVWPLDDLAAYAEFWRLTAVGKPLPLVLVDAL